MEIVVIILGLLFLDFDLTLLKKRASNIFAEVFRFPSREIVFFATALCLALFLMSAKILAIAAVVITGIYLLRRHKFLQRVAASPEYASPTDEKLELAIETFSVMAVWVFGLVTIEFVMLVIQEITHQPQDKLATLLFFSAVSSIFLVILIYRAVRQQKSLKFAQVMGLETKGLGFLKIWLLPMVLGLIYALATTQFLNSRPIQPMTPLQELLNSTTSTGVLVLFVVSAILSAPFFEEIIFRGFFFYIIQPFKGMGFAIIFVALIFGLLHVEQYWGDWGAIAVVGCFGLFLTLLRAWTGSAVPGMIAHYCYNATLIFIPIVTIIALNPLYFDYQLKSYQLNNVEKEERLRQSISQNPKFSNAYNDLAWLYAQQGIKLDEALELIDKALAIDPDQYAFLDTKAEVFFKMGRIEEAIAIEEKLIKKYPKDRYLKEQLEKFKKALSINQIN